MTISMQNLERLSLIEMGEFVQGSRALKISVEGQTASYSFVERLLQAQGFRRLSRGQRGIVRDFLRKVTGLSRAQVSRLIRQWMQTRRVRRKPPQRPHFPRKYTDADVLLLVEVDTAHEELSGPATGLVKNFV